MKTKMIFTATALCLIHTTLLVQAADAVPDSEMGLSKQSVFDTPTPERFSFPESMPGDTALRDRAYPGAPPQIPHSIESMTPIKTGLNFCLSCHGNSAKLSQPLKGKPTPIPASHYTDQRHAPGKVSTTLVGARYVCTQCHVPQANVKTLVGNKF